MLAVSHCWAKMCEISQGSVAIHLSCGGMFGELIQHVFIEHLKCMECASGEEEEEGLKWALES